MEKLLVRVPNWIGDAVMAVAALRELRRLFPRAEITLWARRWVSGLLDDQGFADRVWTPPEADQRRSWGVPEGLRGFDRALLLQNAFSAAWAVWRAAIPERIGYRTDGRGWLLTRPVRPRTKRLGLHQVYYYLDLLYLSGLSDTDYLSTQDFQPQVRLKPSERARTAARALLEASGADPERRPRVAVNPGAFYGSAKRWFPERYAETAQRLIDETGAEILLVGSEAERPLSTAIAARINGQPHILAGRTDLETLAALLADCYFMITNDSGPMHLAAALGIPLIALFGSTDEEATGPLGERAAVIHKHVACSPCLLRECPIDLRCFDRIGVDEVVAKAKRMLAPPCESSP